jgi:hypothetical protein
MSQSGGMSAAGESGLCIVSHRLAWTLLRDYIGRGRADDSASALPRAVLGVRVSEKVERTSLKGPKPA